MVNPARMRDAPRMKILFIRIILFVIGSIALLSATG
jgi:hypothetical protein